MTADLKKRIAARERQLLVAMTALEEISRSQEKAMVMNPVMLAARPQALAIAAFDEAMEIEKELEK